MMIVYILASLAVGTVLCLIAGKRHPWIAQVAYAAVVAASLLTAAKLSPIMDGVFVSVAIGLYSASFLFTDFLGEVYGKDQALRAVYMGIIAEVVVLFAVLMTLAAPSAPFWTDQEAWVTTFGVAPRIMVASISAFIVAQLLDVNVFDWLKKKLDGRLLFVRNNISTFLGQTADSIVFYTIAFLGVPGVDLLSLIVTTCLVKYAIAALDTPFIYLTRAWAQRGESANAPAPA